MTAIDTPTTMASGPVGEPGRAVYTIKETAALLSLSLNTTYALARAGRIPAVQLGGRWVVPKQRFHQWLNQQANQPAAGPDPAAASQIGGAW